MSSPSLKNIWLISREYAGIAEAGGVKNVACSLCEGLANKGISVTLMIPRYACTDFTSITGYTPDLIPPQHIFVAGKDYLVSFDRGFIGKVEVIFVLHQIYSDKSGVYTYTMADEKRDVSHLRGTGFHDALLMDILFQKAVLVYGAVTKNVPQIIHCQDAATAMIPAMARCCHDFVDSYEKVKFVVTVHNAGPGYHHSFNSVQEAHSYTNVPVTVLENCKNGESVEPFLVAGLYSSLTTVSPWYAQELLDIENQDTAGLSQLFIEKNFSITGITNGIDCNRYDPSSKHSSLLPFAFSPERGNLEGKYKNRHYFIQQYASNTADGSCYSDFIRSGYIDEPPTSAKQRREFVYFCYHGRIASQKGIDILADAAALLLSSRNDVRFFMVGQGESALENRLSQLANDFLGKCVYLQGYDRAVSRLSTAAADFIVLPSKFEPCGLEDFIAQLYGTIPVAHATGGLQKILHEQTGFLYTDNSAEHLCQILSTLVDLVKREPKKIQEIISYGANYIKKQYDWDSVICDQYLPFYEKI